MLEPESILTVAGEAELADACAACAAADALALDTEFERSRTYYARPALVQLSAGARCYLIDPLAVADLGPLRALLGDPHTVKVLHGCSEDLGVFLLLDAPLAGPVFDTQLAAAFTGHGYAIGYRRLVRERLGRDLPKDETRSDWLRRPLTESQRRYAALDVDCLLPLYRGLAPELEAAGRRPWLEEETARLLEAAQRPPEPEAMYRRISGAGELDRRALAVLRAVCAWREREAQRRDRPRGFVLPDAGLLAVARRAPQTAQELQGLEQVPAREAQRSGAAIAALCREALRLPPEAWPEALPAAVDLRGLTATMKRLRRAVRERAAALDLPPELLATRRAVEALVRRACIEGLPGLPAELQGWRRTVIGEELLALLAQQSGDADGESGAAHAPRR